MKKITKFLSLTMVFVLIMSMFGAVPTFADSIRKGTARVVFVDTEFAACEDTVVYNGHRYLPFEYFTLGFVLRDSEYEYSKTTYNYANNSATLEFWPDGYISFWSGSTKIRIVSEDLSSYLYYPAILYDGQMYISMEDIAYELDNCNYGYDVEKNTFYFY